MPLGSNSPGKRVLIVSEERELHSTGAGLDEGHGFNTNVQAPFYNTAVSSELDLSKFRNISVDFYLYVNEFTNSYLWGDNVEISIFNKNKMTGALSQTIASAPIKLDDAVSQDPLTMEEGEGVYKITAFFGEDAPSVRSLSLADTKPISDRFGEVDTQSHGESPFGFEGAIVPVHPFLLGSPSTIYDPSAPNPHFHLNLYNEDLTAISGFNFENKKDLQTSTYLDGLLNKSENTFIRENLEQPLVFDITSVNTPHVYTKLGFSKESRIVFSKRNDVNREGINGLDETLPGEPGELSNFEFWPCWFVVHGEER